MDNFNARYEKELAYQEITSNKYTLYGILLFIGVELLIWILNIIGFFELDNQIMSAVIGSSIVLFIPIILIMVKGDLSKPAYKYIAMTQICIITGTIITFFIISRYSSVCSSAFICWTLQKTFCAMVHICIKCINAFCKFDS